MWHIDLGNIELARTRNVERRARCAANDWLCNEVCDRISQVAAAPDVYRAQVAARIERIRAALDRSRRD
jgi:hypothetical protein